MPRNPRNIDLLLTFDSLLWFAVLSYAIVYVSAYACVNVICSWKCTRLKQCYPLRFTFPYLDCVCDGILWIILLFWFLLFLYINVNDQITYLVIYFIYSNTLRLSSLWIVLISLRFVSFPCHFYLLLLFVVSCFCTHMKMNNTLLTS